MKIKVSSIQWLLSCYIILWLNAGNFEYIQGLFPRAVKFGLALLWFFITALMYRGFLWQYLSKAAPIIIMLFLILFSKNSDNAVYAEFYWMNYLYYAIIFAVFVCSFYFYDDRQSKSLLLVLISDIAIVAVRTMFELMRNPILVRAMSTGADSKMVLLDGILPVGVGGYGMCYQLVFCAMLLMIMLNEGSRHKIWILIAELFITYLLFSAQITLALIMLVVGVIAVLVFRDDRKNYMRKVLLIITLFFLLLNIGNILRLLITVAEDDLAQRLGELLKIWEARGGSKGDIVARYRLYKMSLTSFIKNPVWGVFGGEGIGFHSTFLDLLGSFGVLGIVGIVGVLRPIGLTLRQCVVRTARTNLIIIYLAFALLSVVNVSIGSDILLVTTIAIPLFFKMMYYRGDCCENN